MNTPLPSHRAVALSAAALVAALCGSPAQAQRDSASAPALTLVASFDHQVTGVTVAEDGRVFVNFPRWTEDAPVSVAELKNGRLVPYPDGNWNAWRNARKDELSAADHWVCVQSVVADGRGSLWVLDPAAPAMDKVVPGGPKLVQIDLATNRVRRTIAFDDRVAPQGSYLNDVRFSPDGAAAYITDSGARGAIVVVDLASGNARRVLDGHPSTQPEKDVVVTYGGKPLRRPDGRGVEFAADGIALSPDGRTLYWQAIKGKTLYSVPTEALAAGDPADKVVRVGDNGPADGLWIGRKDGRMFITAPEDDAVKVRDLAAPGSTPQVLLRDKRLRWPDTFAEGPDGRIYVTTSRIQDSAYYKPSAPAALPTQLWSFAPRRP
ncbi:L-dopachrome tautomerase-related protein [Piscinibacter koreensis]|uniref:PD40 domain-containing protein n=1 Tax=Piscinibacter koreensis TaxID=2742824 RepID=A0A7Y6NMX0_9BURK|nr:L-dopachrome tautomerase-related protein [Schlegelella koreensis]NUZ06115.1 PD40 domain-containing protein [Schlegelella koreensis]